MKKFIIKAKSVLNRPQETIISAAGAIMVMTIFARVFGLIRLRVLAHFFEDEMLTLFLASFRLPDLIFEVLTLGALSSAFIPVFTKVYKKDPKTAWDMSARVVNIGLIFFVVLAGVFGLLAPYLYRIIAPGFSYEQTSQIAYLARVLFTAQGFFIVSYTMTGILESRKRFIVPALAPIFYNSGIVLGTVMWASTLGLLAPAIGVVIGAFAHFLVQLPFAYNLGFRFKPAVRITKDVRKIAKLALPRVFELSILQVSKIAELFLASLISLAAYTHYTFAVSVQAIPVGFFGLSMGKAALPILSGQSDEPEKFIKTLLSTIYQIAFFVIPIAGLVFVLRIPIVRLLFGAGFFDWQATVQTGLILSAFAVGIPFQATGLILTRAFYALHDTKTPVKVSLLGSGITIISGFIMVLVLSLPTWSMALAYAFGQMFSAITLFILISKRLNHGTLFRLKPIFKSLIAATASSFVMYFVLKIFDRSVWVKQLSFLGHIKGFENINFENFVLDTRFTFNLTVLTLFTAILGAAVYLSLSWLMKSQELNSLLRIIQKGKIAPPLKREEAFTPVPGDTSQV